MQRRPVAVLAAVVAVTAVLAGCSGSSDGTDHPSPSSTATATSSASASASPSPSVTAFAHTCDDALPLMAVSQAAGQPIVGTTSFVVGEADPSIGRLAYLNCRYGIPEATPGAPAPTAAPVPLLEIGVSLYNSADRAASRVAGTVADYRSTGSAAAEIPVGTATGTILTGSGPTTLVVADGARTVAVTADPSIVLGNQTLVAVAALALTNAT